MKRILTLVVAALVLATTAAFAAPVYGTPADLSGSRSEGNGVTTIGDYASDGLMQSISWDITDNGDGTWTYSYTLTNFASPDISHFILDLTDDCVSGNSFADPGCVVTTAEPLAPGTYDGSLPSNPGMPAPITGVKFDFGSNTYEFTSNRNPVWGDFYTKGGVDSAAWNDGLENHASEDVMDFIARPDGPPDQVIPEPATFLMIGGGLLVVGLIRLRKK